MKAGEKAEAINAFSSGICSLLVATTVIEVGVNVPNATVMVIENAEMFGLSTLHQLRGRVGRGYKEAECYLVSSSEGKTARQRLELLTQTTDGFKIANEDLLIRGPGEFLGSRQKGTGDLYMAHMIRDLNAFSQTKKAYEELRNDESYKKLVDAIDAKSDEKFLNEQNEITFS